MTDCGKTVVVIDDEEDVRDMLRFFLESEGYTVEVASDGVEGLALLGRVTHPCFILLDLLMPNMDGYEFRRRQVADPSLADIPVFVSTSATEKLPADLPLIPKPVDPDVLLQAVKHACG